MKDLQKAQRGDPVKVTHGNHTGEKGTLVRVNKMGTNNCTITVKLDCGKRTFADGHIAKARKTARAS